MFWVPIGNIDWTLKQSRMIFIWNRQENKSDLELSNHPLKQPYWRSAKESLKNVFWGRNHRSTENPFYPNHEVLNSEWTLGFSIYVIWLHMLERFRADAAWSGEELLKNRVTEWALNNGRNREKGHPTPAVWLARTRGKPLPNRAGKVWIRFEKSHWYRTLLCIFPSRWSFVMGRGKICFKTLTLASWTFGGKFGVIHSGERAKF